MSARKGRKSVAQTPAPKSDRIKGSKTNKPGSAASKASAKSIQLSEKVVKTLKDKADKYNETHSSKVSVNTLKAVFRRGAGAYSTSHRPTITGGAPNSRNAWSFARVNKFLLKKGGTKVKAAYVQDDDLMAKGGKVFNDTELLAKWKKGESIGFTGEAHLKAKGLIPRADGHKRKSEKYMENGGQLGKEVICVNCSWYWNTNQSEDSDKYVCHKCGFDNTLFYSNDIMSKGGLIAPNGKPSNLTPEQYKLVRTPQFKEWFGDWENDPQNASKVVDDNGEPLVVYHGTYAKEKFNIFDFSKADLGFHFGTYEQAKNRSFTKFSIKEHKQFIEPFFLNIRQLFLIEDAMEFEYPQSYIGDLVEKRILTKGEVSENSLRGLETKKSNQVVRNILVEKYKKLGFKYHNKLEGEGYSYIVCEPNQIKLADGTNKNFDMNNPDIRYKQGGYMENGGELIKYKTIASFDDNEVFIYDGKLGYSDILKLTNKLPKNINQIQVNLKESSVLNTLTEWSQKEVKKTFNSDFKAGFPIIYSVVENGEMNLKKAYGELKNGKNVIFDVDYLTWEEGDIEMAKGGELGQEINCHNCGWHWNTNESDDFDKYVCHKCGFDNTLFYSTEIMEKFYEFADKRLQGAEKITNDSKEKGGLSMLTYYHYNAKLPTYEQASKGGFDLEKAKQEFDLYYSQLSYNMKQVEFQELMGKMEVLGELIIEEMSIQPEVMNTENGTFEEEFKEGGVVVGKRHSEEDENGTGERFLVESTGQVVEVEGGEGVLSKESMNSDRKYDLDGEKMTGKQIASKLNHKYGGVEFAEGGEVGHVCGCRSKYYHGGELPSATLQGLSGGEAVVTVKTMESKDLYTFQGKKMTPRKILSKINADSGGKKFEEGGTIDLTKNNLEKHNKLTKMVYFTENILHYK